MCIEERKWLLTQGCDKKRMRNSFIEKRKAFAKKVQYFKRQNWKRSQSELIDSCNTDPEEFWKKIWDWCLNENRIFQWKLSKMMALYRTT